MKTMKINQSVLGAMSLAGLAAIAATAAGQPVYETGKLKASDAGRLDNAGYSVSIHSGVVVMSISGDDDQGVNAGAAVLFDAALGTELHKLVAPDGSAGDGFSKSLSIFGDLVVVGADSDDDAGDSSGSAYAFNTSTGAFLFKLNAPDGSTQDFFGASIATNGLSIIVGSPRDDDGGMDAGSVYMFDGVSGAYVRKLTAPDGSSDDRFGSSVAIGSGLILVGSPFDDDGGSASGSVYIFDSVDGSYMMKLVANDAAAGDRFGTSVCISEGLIGVGSPGDSLFAGSAYLFDSISGQQLQKLFASDASSDDSFGQSVAIDGHRVVCGSYGNDDGAPASGSAYLFDTNTGEELAKLLPSDPSLILNLGISVGIEGSTILCGAPADDDVSQDSGAVYVFEAPTPPCPADLTGDGLLNFFDVSAFLGAFSANDPIADFTNDGQFNFFDVSAFLAAYSAGCP